MLHMMLGGFINLSAVILWSFTSPLSALVLNTRKSALNWFAGFLALLVMSAAYDPFITQSAHFQDVFIRVMFVLNMGGVLSIAFILLFYYVNLQRKALRASEESGARSDRLLKNMLPPRVAHVLKSKSNPGMIAEAYPEATVMFADLSGFTTLSGSMSAKELVEMLDGLYSYFDELVERHGIEKIRTIGDNYMVAAGVPEARDDHAEAIATMALDIKDYCLSLDMINGRDILFKMGMHSGPVIGGVVGKKNLHFDIWGDTVNTASRMETHGLPGMIQVTETTYKLLKARFALEPRGVIDVKSKGQMRTWFLMGRK
jgi:guanylate cyclase